MKNLYIIIAVGLLAFLAYYFYFSAIATCTRDYPNLSRTGCERMLNKSKIN